MFFSAFMSTESLFCPPPGGALNAQTSLRLHPNTGGRGGSPGTSREPIGVIKIERYETKLSQKYEVNKR